MAELTKTSSGAVAKKEAGENERRPGSGETNEENRFSLSEIVVGGIFVFTTDSICALLDVFTLESTAIIDWIIRNGVAAILWMWFKKKESSAMGTGKLVFKFFGNITPFFINTIMFFIDTYAHNHPEKFAAIEKVAGGGKSKV